MRISLSGVSVRYGGSEPLVLREIDLAVDPGTVCALLGPNGAGKSTLLKVVAGLVDSTEGSARLGDCAVRDLDSRQVAQRVAIVHQRAEVAPGFTVREVIAMGRAPHQDVLMRMCGSDRAIVDEVIDRCELQSLGARPLEALSGGEQQRVHVARALAQQAPVLLLDEATAHLDIRHAQALRELVRQEVHRRSLAALVVVHDLAAAAQIADRIVLMRAGEVVADGAVAEVMTPELLELAFDVPVTCGTHHDGRRYFIVDDRA